VIVVIHSSGYHRWYNYLDDYESSSTHKHGQIQMGHIGNVTCHDRVPGPRALAHRVRHRDLKEMMEGLSVILHV
jgi:hypothetical protein